jgi:hypothetical protein
VLSLSVTTTKRCCARMTKLLQVAHLDLFSLRARVLASATDCSPLAHQAPAQLPPPPTPEQRHHATARAPPLDDQLPRQKGLPTHPRFVRFAEGVAWRCGAQEASGAALRAGEVQHTPTVLERGAMLISQMAHTTNAGWRQVERVPEVLDRMGVEARRRIRASRAATEAMSATPPNYLPALCILNAFLFGASAARLLGSCWWYRPGLCYCRFRVTSYRQFAPLVPP